MCGRHALLPTSLKTPISSEQTGNALYRGGSADVWKGVHDGRDVAVKVLRTYTSGELLGVIKASCWLCYVPVCLRADSAPCRDSARKLLYGKPCDIRTSCL